MWDDDEFPDDDSPDDDSLDDEPLSLRECPECGVEVYEDAVRCPACGSYVTWDEPVGRSARWDRLVKLGLVLVVLSFATAWGLQLWQVFRSQ